MEILLEAFRSLGKDKLRTFLSMLGIVIGVIAVIVAIAIGAGTTANVTARISSLGSNVIIITPGFTGGFGGRAAMALTSVLQETDVQNIQQMAPDVADVTPILQKNFNVIYQATNTVVTVVGAYPDTFSILDLPLQSGRLLNQNDENADANVAVIGNVIATTLFGNEDPVGQTVYVSTGGFQVPITIVGELKQTGSKLTFNPDNMLIIPYTTAAAKLIQLNGGVSQIIASAKSAQTALNAVDEINNILYMRLQNTNQYRVISQNQILSTVSQTTDVLTLLLASIAAISMVVGGIGIMNIMLVSVTERTKEIGVKMAMGATRRRIMVEFLVESMFITIVAGAIGVGLSFLIAALVTYLASGLGLTVIITWPSIVLSFGVSVAIGLFFGLYPAYLASKKSPVEALRYE
ncbi:MAG: ABC transporter substrate-binding protein [Mesoaciditoga sp.]|uniref:ABC transporter permease n=1 Tax=Athalassotoga sp. TaxID=2022597 RepID=UPI000CA74929|nr:MAG: ABC transporter substrate-binding protein [Mesoaciditoga sp.]PMP79139.1 MAG: ABC transporter substrate-binding protein [Mesoaciditoga sp.]HEU23840.1 FtsX-like permease family protein [Mesoaciditoga lauensis]